MLASLNYTFCFLLFILYFLTLPFVAAGFLFRKKYIHVLPCKLKRFSLFSSSDVHILLIFCIFQPSPLS